MIYFILCVIIQYYFIYLFAQIVPVLAIGRFFSVDSCVPSTYSPHHFMWCVYLYVFFLLTSLFSGMRRRSKLTMYISFLQLAIFKGLLLLLMKNQMRNQDLGTRYAHCYLGSLRTDFWKIKEIHLYTHFHKYLYMWPSVSISSETWVYIHVSNSNLLPQNCFSLLPLAYL